MQAYVDSCVSLVSSDFTHRALGLESPAQFRGNICRLDLGDVLPHRLVREYAQFNGV